MVLSSDNLGQDYGPLVRRAVGPCQAASGHPFLLFLTPLLSPLQEQLRHIGPEEFVQAFVNKDPLASTKVEGPWTDCPGRDPYPRVPLWDSQSTSSPSSRGARNRADGLGGDVPIPPMPLAEGWHIPAALSPREAWDGGMSLTGSATQRGSGAVHHPKPWVG